MPLSEVKYGTDAAVLIGTDHRRTLTLSKPAVDNFLCQPVGKLDRETAQRIGWRYPDIGNPIGQAKVSRETFVKPQWPLRRKERRTARA
jgi:hypothetical protein